MNLKRSSHSERGATADLAKRRQAAKSTEPVTAAMASPQTQATSLKSEVEHLEAVAFESRLSAACGCKTSEMASTLLRQIVSLERPGSEEAPIATLKAVAMLGEL